MELLIKREVPVVIQRFGGRAENAHLK